MLVACVRLTSQNYWRPCWRTDVIKMATETKEVEPLMLSNYSKNLEGNVKYRYLDKISEIGIDPLQFPAKTLSEECLPPVESMDLLSYLVLDTKFYSNAKFKAYRSVQAYNQMVSGFISSVLESLINNRFVVLAKVRHKYSQRLDDPLVQFWIKPNEEGTVMSAHCAGCMAGLGDCCSHIASVLFYLEVVTRQNERLACTQVECGRILPSYVEKVHYAKVKDINFSSARKLKAGMEKSLNDLSLCCKNDNSDQSPVTN